MRKVLAIILGACLLLMGGCTEYVSMDADYDYSYEEYLNSTRGNYATITEAPVQSGTAETANTDPIYLEITFGNSEVLRTEVAYFMVPTSSPDEYNGAYGGWDFCDGYTTTYYNGKNFSGIIANSDSVLSVGEPSLEEKLKINKLSTAGAILPNGMVYNFNEAYTVSVNNETRTVYISVWRDEPYPLERQYFTD